MDTSKEFVKMCEKAEEIQAILDFKYYTIENVFAVKEKKKECIHEGEKTFISYSYDKIYCSLCGKKLKEYQAEFIETYNIKPTGLNFVWLPRQDQLQELVKDKVRDNQKTTHAYVKGPNPEGFINVCLLTDFYFWQERIAPLFFTSMEQLWLAFVMKEKYHKIWNGEDWVEERN